MLNGPEGDEDTAEGHVESDAHCPDGVSGQKRHIEQIATHVAQVSADLNVRLAE